MGRRKLVNGARKPEGKTPLRERENWLGITWKGVRGITTRGIRIIGMRG